MKRTFKYALAVVLGATMVAPAMAQDQFPDVPASHWAYKELLELKSAGLLVGYPDGLFRGGRPASRYELAVAIHAVWMNLKGQQDALKAQIDDLSKRMDGMASKADLDALKAQIDALQAEVGRIKSEDIAKLNRLTDEFKAELTKMGANVDEIKKGLAALEGRVSAIEKRLPSFDVTGSADAVVLGGYGTSQRNGITVDGRPTGVGRNTGFGSNGNLGVNKDLSVFHEAAFNVMSHEEDGDAKLKWMMTGVFGNMLGESREINVNTPNPNFSNLNWGNQSRVTPGASFAEQTPTLYFQRFAVMFNTSLAGLKFNAEVGRVGYMVSPMMFKRPDSTPYFSNERWDDGNWTFDGGKLGFNFGKVALNVFGGRVSSVVDTRGNAIQPMFAGQFGHAWSPSALRPYGFQSGNFLSIDQMLGAHVSVPLSSAGGLNLAYILLDSNTVINTGTSVSPVLHNGVTVWGADANFKFGALGVSGSYSKSDLRYNTRSTVKKNNAAWTADANYQMNKLGISAGYKRIEPQYGAPGDWGRIGIWWNPTNLEGFHGKVTFDLNEKLRLAASGEFYKGLNTVLSNGSFSTGMTANDKVNRYVVGLEYKMASNYNLQLGWERVDWDIKSNSFTGQFKPYEQWINVGFGFDLSSKAKLSFLWQISDYNGKNSFFSAFAGGDGQNGNPRATGGLLSTDRKSVV